MVFPSRQPDRKKPVLLDGALGTEIERRGVPTPLPLWSAAALETAPDVVGRIHAEYVAAGCDVLTANTFRTTPAALAAAGRPAGDAPRLARLAVDLARAAARAADRPVSVAGAIAPLADCYRPDQAPPADAARAAHGRQCEVLAAAGVDLILIETMNTVREARAAIAAARATGLPVWASLIPGPDLTLLDGTPLADALARLADDGPDALLLNCLPVDYADACLPLLASAGPPFGIYANASRVPGAVFRADDRIAPDAYAAAARGWAAAGACVVGGCCGTSPDHLRAVAALFS